MHSKVISIQSTLDILNTRYLDVSNKKLGPLAILLSKTTTRYLELSMSRTISRSP